MFLRFLLQKRKEHPNSPILTIRMDFNSFSLLIVTNCIHSYPNICLRISCDSFKPSLKFRKVCTNLFLVSFELIIGCTTLQLVLLFANLLTFPGCRDKFLFSQFESLVAKYVHSLRLLPWVLDRLFYSFLHSSKCLFAAVFSYFDYR